MIAIDPIFDGVAVVGIQTAWVLWLNAVWPAGDPPWRYAVALALTLGWALTSYAALLYRARPTLRAGTRERKDKK